MDIRKALQGLSVVVWFAAAAAAQEAGVPPRPYVESPPVTAAPGLLASPATCGFGGCTDGSDAGLWTDLPAASPCPTYFSVTADALFLQLNRGEDRVLVLDDVSGDPVLSTDDLTYDMVGGPRLGLRYAGCSGGYVDLSYFGLHQWDATESVIGSQTLSLPDPLGSATTDFSAANVMTAFQSAEIHNAEANLIRPTRYPGIKLLAGFRYFSLTEQFNLTSEAPLSGTSDYRTHTANNLVGGQIGASLNRQWGTLGFELIGKMGLFGNDSQQRTFLGDVDNTVVLRDSYTRAGQVAFIGDLGIQGTLQVTQSVWCRFGYNLIWVEGVARASDQLDFSNAPYSGTALVNDGSAFLHGVNVGLEARW